MADAVLNDQTGEQIEFLLESPELLRMRAKWPPDRSRTPRHSHPLMQERWEVVVGRGSRSHPKLLDDCF